MNLFRSISVVTRKLGILLAIILLVSLALFLYYFKYVPDNKERIQHQAFLILKQEADGIQQNLMDFKNYFRTRNKDFYNKKKNFKDTIDKENLKYTIESHQINRGFLSISGAPEIELLLHDNQVAFHYNSRFQATEFKLALDNLFKTNLSSVKQDYFQSQFIVCQRHSEHHADEEGKKDRHKIIDSHHKESAENQPHVLYYTDGLFVSEHLIDDSLGKILSSAQFSKIINLEINGSEYKAFMLPFPLEGNSLILAGLMPNAVYNGKMENIPFSTISTLAILFLLILISLPYIKIFLIGSEEQFGIKDIVFLGISLFLGTACLVIILQHVLMVKGAQLRSQNSLRVLSEKINDQFTKEISKAYAELKYLDSELSKTISSPGGNPAGANSCDIVIFIKKNTKTGDSGYLLPYPAGGYLNYHIVSWSDINGQQMMKGRTDASKSPFVNVSRRDYFQNVINNHLYSFKNQWAPNSSSLADSFSFQPVYSMSTKEFEVNISIPSRIKKMVAVISTHMRSVMDVIAPPGFGFYIIDNEGLIKFQSEGPVTLSQNFLEQINNQDGLENTLKNRESRFIPNQYINDRQYNLFVRPVSNLPLSLVVYNCKDHTTASIMHINGFILTFLALLYILLFIFLLVAWNNSNHYSKLNQSISQFDWVKPSGKKSEFYQFSNIYLPSYCVSTFLYCFLAEKNFNIWFIGMTCPIFAAWTLYTIFKFHGLKNANAARVGIRKKILDLFVQPYNVTPIIFIILLNIFYSKIDHRANPDFLVIYQAVSFIPVLFFIFWNPGPKITSVPNNSIHYGYRTFWFLSVCALSILPAFCFFQYAQKKEIALQIKSDQLNLIQSVENRLTHLKWFDKIASTRNFPSSLKDSILFREGVYFLSPDDTLISSPHHQDIAFNDVMEPYDTITRILSWNRALDKTLSFQNAAMDGQWNSVETPARNFHYINLYYTIPSEDRKPQSISSVSTLNLKFFVPPIFRFYQMNNPLSIIIVSFFSVFLLYLFFRLIGTICKRLFHPWNLKERYLTDDDLIQKAICGDASLSIGIEKTIKDNLTLLRFYTVLNEEPELLGKLVKLEATPLTVPEKQECLDAIWKGEYGLDIKETKESEEERDQNKANQDQSNQTKNGKHYESRSVDQQGKSNSEKSIFLNPAVR